MATPGTALIKRVDELTSTAIQKVEVLKKAFEALREACNLLSPVASVDHIMPMHQVSLRAVMLDSSVDQNGNGADCYRDPRFCKAGEVALGKNALMKLMAGAGVQVVDRQRLDDRSDPNYCEVQVTLAVRDFDGTMRQMMATKEMDLRTGSPETLKPEKVNNEKTGRMIPFDDSALSDKRRHIQSHAETKAIERGLRAIFALKQKYTVDELKRPFVVPKLVANLDPSDPETKTALIQHALSGETRLYGPPPASSGRPTLAPASPALTGGETIDTKTGEVITPDDPDDFGEPPAPEPEEPIAAHLCATCPCGCQNQTTPEVAARTLASSGAVRCGACYPWSARFDVTRHKDLGPLGMPKFPDVDGPKGVAAHRTFSAGRKAGAR